ncbi:DUF4266 domain-containing protein [Fulvivirgaceae bacterium BMA10]|uniref:DUF4266 domain-containing protein n=1 Tax=Splendidivirga corallicola TaxID=3051826 RepID=A0ABT8KPI2_9BACT|nr:DUF4266 domain-containing protein [Fulvivirgaceae bacterium BMA10]
MVRVLFFFVILSGFSSCVSVEAYQKMYLNDEEMALKARKIEYFEINIESYREGSSGANGGKVGGGCGCN